MSSHHIFTTVIMVNTAKKGISGLRFVSWNVKGLNGPVKRDRVFSHLRQLKTEIAFLQETHLTTTDHHKLKAFGLANLSTQILAAKQGVQLF